MPRHFKDEHECKLGTQLFNAGLQPLPPFAGCCPKVLNYLRKFFIMNIDSTKSKEFFKNKSTRLFELRRYLRGPDIFVIHPFSTFSSIFDVCFAMVWLYRFYTIPFLPNVIFKQFTNYKIHAFYLIEHFLCGLQLCIFITFFFLGYVNTTKADIVTNHKLVVIHYLKTYFLFDFFCIIYHFFLDQIKWKASIKFYIGLTTSICYFVRFGFFTKCLENITRMLINSKYFYFLMTHMLNIFLAVHFLSCLMFYVPMVLAEPFYPKKESWIVQSMIIQEIYSNTTDYMPILPFKKLIRVFSDGVSMTYCNFFGIHHEAYTISLPSERLICTFTLFFGRLYTLIIIGNLLRLFGLANVSKNKYEQYLNQLEHYMLSKNLPIDLRKRLLSYYEYKLQGKFFDETQIQATLSEHLKTEIYLFGARKLIEKAYVLKTLPKLTLGTLFAHMKSETYLPSDIIIRIGSKAEFVYFISSGTVALFNNKGEELLHLEDGDEFGLISFFTPKGVQIYKAVAIETTEVYYLSKKVFMEIFQGHPDAIKYFESRGIQRTKQIMVVEDILKLGGKALISGIRTATIFEQPNLRTEDIETRL